MEAEFDVVAEWTRGAVEHLGPDHAIPAACRGSERLWISDHFHPWNDEQGQSPFV
jgi:hypothetical protein